uniref:Uncharacterized protein n=1 Tax=Eutreptiella gymnastica TaxID=73025 RepID=A0A7S1IPC0_9EUGL
MNGRGAIPSDGGSTGAPTTLTPFLRRLRSLTDPQSLIDCPIPNPLSFDPPTHTDLHPFDLYIAKEAAGGIGDPEPIRRPFWIPEDEGMLRGWGPGGYTSTIRKPLRKDALG